MGTTRYVALLRGINLGPHKKVSMAILKQTLEKHGYQDVKTLLNSGNVVFTTQTKNQDALTHELEELLKKTFGFEIPALIRTMDQIQKLSNRDPFKGIEVTAATRLYVTFLSEKPTSTLKIPYESPEKDLRILSVTPTEVCSVVTVSATRNTTDAMAVFGKEFGKRITTRNWNTVQKLLTLA